MIDVTAEAKESYKKAILAYLKERVQKDSNLAECCKKTNKTIDGVVNYVISEAKKQAKDNVAFIPDDEVYNWVVHYLQEDELNSEPTETTKETPKAEKETPAVSKKAESKPAKKVEEDSDLWKQLDLFGE